MDQALFNKVFNYICKEKDLSSRCYISDKILYRKVAKGFILDKFLNKWLDDPLADPIDIIDDMTLKYYMWENAAATNNNTELIKTYEIYIKILLNLKTFIVKENH